MRECVVRECVVKPHEANNIGSLLTDAKFEPHEANSIEDTGSLLTDVQVASAHEALNDYNHYKAQLLDEEAIAAMMIAEDELECTLEVRPDHKKTKKTGPVSDGR